MNATWVLILVLVTVARLVFSTDCVTETISFDAVEDDNTADIKQTRHRVISTTHTNCSLLACSQSCCSQELCTTAVFTEALAKEPCTCQMLQCHPIAACREIVGDETGSTIIRVRRVKRGISRKKREVIHVERQKREEQGSVVTPGSSAGNITNATGAGQDKMDKQTAGVAISGSTTENNAVVTTQATPERTSGSTAGHHNISGGKLTDVGSVKTVNSTTNILLSEQTIMLPTPSPISEFVESSNGDVITTSREPATTIASSTPPSTSPLVSSSTMSSTNTTKTNKGQSEGSASPRTSTTPATNVTGQITTDKNINSTTIAASTADQNATGVTQQASVALNMTSKEDVTTNSPVTSSLPEKTTIASASISLPFSNGTTTRVINTTTPNLMTSKQTTERPATTQKPVHTTSVSKGVPAKEITSTSPKDTLQTHSTSTGPSTTVQETSTSLNLNASTQKADPSSSSTISTQTQTTSSIPKATDLKDQTSSGSNSSLQTTMSGSNSNGNKSEAEKVKDEELLAGKLIEAILQASPNATDSKHGNDSMSTSTNSLTSEPNHMMVVLVSALSIGVLVCLVVMGLLGKMALEAWKRRHYSRVDFLVNGMYH